MRSVHAIGAAAMKRFVVLRYSCSFLKTFLRTVQRTVLSHLREWPKFGTTAVKMRVWCYNTVQPWPYVQTDTTSRRSAVSAAPFCPGVSAGKVHATTGVRAPLFL